MSIFGGFFMAEVPRREMEPGWAQPWFTDAYTRAALAVGVLSVNGAGLGVGGRGIVVPLRGRWRLVLRSRAGMSYHGPEILGLPVYSWFREAMAEIQIAADVLELNGFRGSGTASLELGDGWRLVRLVGLEELFPERVPSVPSPGFFRAGIWAVVLALAVLLPGVAGAQSRVYRDEMGRIERTVRVEPGGREVHRDPMGRTVETRQGGVRRDSAGRRLGTIEDRGRSKR
jgi:hypothetical protein